MFFYYVYQLWDTFCCVTKTQLGSPANPGWGHALDAKAPCVPCNKPGLVSQNVWCYPELCNQFEPSREVWNQLLIFLTKCTVTAMQDVPFLLLQTGHHARAQHSSLCSLAEPAALLSTLQKQNFIIFLNFNRFLERPGWGFCFLFFFSFWPSVHSMARPLSSTNIRGTAWGKQELRSRWKKFPLVKQR